MRERVMLAGRYWLPVAVAVTAMCALVFFVARQDVRTALDDPQLQIAQDVAARLVDGAEPKKVVGGSVDMAASLAPWAMLYDEAGKPLYGGATLEGTAASPPKGVFEAARESGEHRVTWRPRGDVRIATVVEYWSGKGGSGFVVTGRNMRETEARITRLGRLVVFAWALTLAATFATAFALLPAEARS